MNFAFPYHKYEKDVYFVAEIGANHNQDKTRLANLIYKAKDIGCDAIKLQYYDADTLWSPEFHAFNETTIKRALPFELLKDAFEICTQENISLGCSVFDICNVQKVSEYCNFLKIASYESQWNELIDECLSIGLPLFISTGMCDPLEIISTRDKIEDNPSNVLFHCMSQYPFEGDTLIKHFVNMFCGTLDNFGYSDHTANEDCIFEAVKCGARIIECHLDLDDKKGYEFSHGHCWLPSDLKRCIEKCSELKIENPDKKIAVNKSMDILMNRPDRKDYVLRTDSKDGMRPMGFYREKMLRELEEKE